MTKNRLTAITGGIGAGKSVISRILTAMGYEVYDSDSRAKALMDTSDEIKTKLKSEFGPDVIAPDGLIDRKKLSSIVFNDKKALKALNTIVHKAVLDDIMSWHSSLGNGHHFVETAILYQSGMDRIVDDVWEVTAPETVRIERILIRNGFSDAEARSRIESQKIVVPHPHPKTSLIDNSGVIPVLPQIHSLLSF